MPDAGTQLDLSSDEVDRIIGFLGYGRVSAPVGFIGLEEGLGRRNDLDAVPNLKARASLTLSWT